MLLDVCSTLALGFTFWGFVSHLRSTLWRCQGKRQRFRGLVFFLFVSEKSKQEKRQPLKSSMVNVLRVICCKRIGLKRSKMKSIHQSGVSLAVAMSDRKHLMAPPMELLGSHQNQAHSVYTSTKANNTPIETMKTYWNKRNQKRKEKKRIEKKNQTLVFSYLLPQHQASS